MKLSRASILTLAISAIALLLARAPRGGEATSEWPGVDEAVIGRFVSEAGRPPPRAILDWVRGDALLFAFLCAGLIAGFLLGFWGRALFSEQVYARGNDDRHG